MMAFRECLLAWGVLRMRRPRKVVTRTAPKTRRRAVVVLGMHRSGTSALAGALHLAGAGEPKTPIPADENNQRGYWEPAPLVQAHDEFLTAIGSSWADWRGI